MNSTPVPPEESWGNWGADLDQKSAHELFAGKTIDEVLPLFQNVHGVFDELLFMPPVPFRYYVLAFRDFVMSGRDLPATEAPDTASCFLSLILAKLRNEPEAIRPVMSKLLPAVEFVADNQAWFGADIDIYGSFPSKLEEIRSLYQDA